MVRVDEELSAELLERADRDQAARMSLRPGHLLAAEGLTGGQQDDEPAGGG
jgi:hypothetical protein